MQNVVEISSLEYFVEWDKSCVATVSGRISKTQVEGDFNLEERARDP